MVSMLKMAIPDVDIFFANLGVETEGLGSVQGVESCAIVF